MRNLDALNAAVKSTRHVFTISLVVPFGMGFGAWALAAGAAPGLPLHDNYLEMLALAIMTVTLLSLPIPYIFRWNWETKYFGAGLLSFGSGSIIGIYPLLCIGLYSSLPITLRLSFILSQAALIAWWCSRFVRIYEIIYRNKRMFNFIYAEEETAVYLVQQADKKIVEKVFKLNQFPGTKLTVLPMILAFSMAPFATSVSRLSGIPFIHIFLAIGMTPANLMFLGLSTKAWLIFYHYPGKIKKQTNKPVYIDKSSPAPKHVHFET